MLDHMTFRVSNIEKSRDFYAAALAPLGYQVAYEEEHEGARIVGLGYASPEVPGSQKIDTWLINGPSPYGGKPVTTGCHLCWSAASRTQVDAFHQAALGHGGRDNGAPGLRPHYHPHYYGAFVIDPDGNNVEACCHLPE